MTEQCKAGEKILNVVQARVPRGEKAFPVGHGEEKQDDADRREDPEDGLKGSHQELMTHSTTRAH